MQKINSKVFSSEIESCVTKEKLSYLDAIIYLCEQKDLDPGKVTSFINKVVKEKLRAEAIDLRMLKEKKGGVLPIK